MGLLTFDFTHILVEFLQICDNQLPIPLTFTIFLHFLYLFGIGSRGQQKVKPIWSIFAGSSQLIMTKYYIMLN